MATTRDLMNKTLRGMRQFSLIIPDTTNDTSDEYLLMILQFVNEAKAEIEESGWAWRALRKTVTVTLAVSQVEYDLTIAADADVDTNDRSRLLYETSTGNYATENFRLNDFSVPQVFDVTDTGESRLKEVTQERMERYHLTDNNEEGNPQYFALYQDSDSIKMKVWPIPNAVRTIKMRFYIPSDDLVETNLSEVVQIQSRPIWTKALFKANEERGSELGKPGSALEKTYMDAHGAAVASEMNPADSTVFLDR